MGGNKNMKEEQINLEDEQKIEEKTEPILDREVATGFSLTGELVNNLEDKSFTIVGYKTILVKDLENPNKKKEKLVLIVRLHDGTQVDYFPNRTSQQTVISKRGFAYKNWVGYENEFVVHEQKIGKELKKVIYIE
jgi:hypothetical protein